MKNSHGLTKVFRKTFPFSFLPSEVNKKYLKEILLKQQTLKSFESLDGVELHGNIFFYQNYDN